MVFGTIEQAIEDVRNGKFVIVADDEDRENEGDLICAAQLVTPEMINFMIKKAGGMICLALTGDRVDALGLSPMAILLGMMLLLIFLGIFVDQVSMMLITLPVFMPIVQRLDIDLIWFGVLYLICMQLGLLLPPHGLLLMTMKGVAPPQVTMADIFRAVVPYVVMSLLLLLLLIAVPPIATWLPALLG